MADTRSLTYDELGRLLGMTPGSVRGLVRKRRWARTTGNDGLARISVPVEYLDAKAATTAGASDSPTGSPTAAASAPPPSAGDTAAAAITALAEQLRRAGLDLDALRGERDAARAELATTKAEHAALATLPAQVAALEATLAAMTAERDRWYATANRPLLARLFGRRAA